MERKARQVRRSRAFWKKTVEEFAASGQSQNAFAQSKGLKQTTLGRWLRKLGLPKEAALVRSDLIEIVTSPPEQSKVVIGTTRLRVGGATVEFSELPPVAYVASLLREVASC